MTLAMSEGSAGRAALLQRECQWPVASAGQHPRLIRIREVAAAAAAAGGLGR